MPVEPFKRKSVSDYGTVFNVLRQLLEAGLMLHRILERHVLLVRDRIRYQGRKPVGILRGDAEDPGHVLQDSLGLFVCECDDLSYMVASVMSGDILNDLTASFLAEVYVEVRHGHPVRVEEPFEEKSVPHGVDVRNPAAVSDKGSGTGTSSRTYGNPVVLGPVDVVGDYKEVCREVHLFDDSQFVVQPLLKSAAKFLVCIRIPLVQSLVGQCTEIFRIRSVFLRYTALGKYRSGKLQFHVAPVGHLKRVGKKLRVSGEQ